MTHPASARWKYDLIQSHAARAPAAGAAVVRSRTVVSALSRGIRRPVVLWGRRKGLRREHHSRLLEHPFGRALAPAPVLHADEACGGGSGPFAHRGIESLSR